MVKEQLSGSGCGVTNARVLAAMGKVPRHEFIPAEIRHRAYDDSALPIGHGQTISQPFIVAFMTGQLNPQPTDRVLEIGTGWVTRPRCSPDWREKFSPSKSLMRSRNAPQPT